ncbi:MAG: glycosyltransferase [Acidobacteriota bacterium]
MQRVCVGIHVHSDPERLAATLASVRANTAANVECVLLPDGPDAAAAAFLATVRGVTQAGTTEPLGAAACFNRLVSFSGADVFVQLESGAQVGPGWLDYLLGALEADPRNGLAGPSTNLSWNEQAAFPRAEGRAGEIARTAREAERRYGWTNRTLEPLYSLSDFCYAVRREVVEAIGVADEGYGLGPCWEMDYNIRAARAGWRGVWACAAYVHRVPFNARRRLEEARRFEASKRRYQDKFCALRLRRERTDYEPHCKGDECEHFAPAALIQLKIQLAGDVSAKASSASDLASSADSTVLPAAPLQIRVEPPPPLVSCVMATRDRAEFVLQSIRYFERQDYPARELIIIDDGRQSLEGLWPDDSRIRYVRLAQRQSIGAKRNLGCELAQGSIVAQWDDDDWYAPERLSVQAAPLISGEADITALTAEVFFDLPRWEFWRCTPELHRRLFVEDVHGGTLVYRREVWEKLARYPDCSLAEDAGFLRQVVRRGARLAREHREGLFVYVRHATNSWSFSCGQFLDSRGWLRVGEPRMPASDRTFYASRSQAPGSADVPPASSALDLGASAMNLECGDLSPLWSHSNQEKRRQVAALQYPNEGPLVSCIMPTYNRRSFARQAIEYFLRQSYVNSELIIVDDGEDAVGDLAPADLRVRYLRLGARATIGAKRNFACEQARGELIVHWDDDDWMATRRLGYQVESMTSSGADLCGLDRPLFYDPRTDRAWEYVYPRGSKFWVAGSTLCYTKSFWRQNPFPNINVGEDTRFVWGARARRMIALEDTTFFVAIVHPGNTSVKRTNDARYRVKQPAEIRKLLGDDLGFYIETASSGAQR